MVHFQGVWLGHIPALLTSSKTYACVACYRTYHYIAEKFVFAIKNNATNPEGLVALVRVQGVEPWSQPWEGYIIAVIRHPRVVMCTTE